ncbi:MAG TPA: Gfo/Idh/MocA family oxidoreductase [Tepidisphaeraceae bacterium]|jgi:predicted dehydrogenase
MRKLRWGILGTGNIARQFVAGVIGSERGVVTAVGSRSPAAAAAFSESLGINAVAGSYADVVGASECDALYVSLPNTLHHAWAIAGMKAGKHVLCEKPLAVTAAEAEEMFDVSRRTGRVLIEAFMYRAHPQTQKAIELVRGGAIGKVHSVRTSFCFRVRKIAGNIRFDPALAGGALMDVGCYCVNFSRLFAAGEPADVHAVAAHHVSGVDELVSGIMRFANGAHADFVVAMNTHADNTAYVCGDEGFLRIPVPWKPAAGGGEVIVARSTPPKQDGGATTAPPPEIHRITDARPLYGIEADAFAACVLDGAPPFVDAADSVGNARVLDTLRQLIAPTVQ